MWVWIKAAMSSVADFLIPILKLFLSDIGPALGKAAVSAVGIVAQDLAGKTSTEKRNAAYRLIVDELKDQGITAAESAINAAIEVAVLKLKG